MRSEAALDGVSDDEINLQTESFAQIALQAGESEETDVAVQIHQQIEITVIRLLAADIGAEHAQLPNRISPPQLRLHPAQLRDDLVQRFHSAFSSGRAKPLDARNGFHVEVDISQNYANSRAGDRAGFFVVKERVVLDRRKKR